MQTVDLLTCVLLAVPHVLYASIWYQPHIWKRCFGKDAVSAFAKVATALKGMQPCTTALVMDIAVGKAHARACQHIEYKSCFAVVQFASVAVWWVCRQHGGHGLYISNIATSRGLLCILLVFAGQILNVAIYRAIGAVGVYYGFKLGHTVPWHTGFPFNVIAHPQYVGSVLTIWGMGILLWPQAPPNFGFILAFWTALYIATAIQEQWW